MKKAREKGITGVPSNKLASKDFPIQLSPNKIENSYDSPFDVEPFSKKETKEQEKYLEPLKWCHQNGIEQVVELEGEIFRPYTYTEETREIGRKIVKTMKNPMT